MRLIALIAALALTTATTAAIAARPGHSAAVSCGVERWAVKTLSDRDKRPRRFSTARHDSRGARRPPGAWPLAGHPDPGR
jgi:hypothetical protein